MTNVTYVIDAMISMAEAEMAERDKHLISVERLRQRVRRRLPLDARGDDSVYCMDTGLNFLISQRLYAKGYRSVRSGFHVNLDRCFDVDYLVKLSDNADLAAEEKAYVSERIRAIKETRCDGQYVLDIDENGTIVGTVETMNEEEFMEKVVSDAV